MFFLALVTCSGLMGGVLYINETEIAIILPSCPRWAMACEVNFWRLEVRVEILKAWGAVVCSPDWLRLLLSMASRHFSFLAKAVKEMDVGWGRGEGWDLLLVLVSLGCQKSCSEKGTGFTQTRWKDCLFPLESSIKMTNPDTL